MTPTTWNENTFQTYKTKTKLKFGYYFDDGVTISSPPVRRAISTTIEALKSQGHEVIQIKPPNVVEAVQVFVSLTADEGYIIANPPHVDVLVTPIFVNLSLEIQWN